MYATRGAATITTTADATAARHSMPALSISHSLVITLAAMPLVAGCVAVAITVVGIKAMAMKGGIVTSPSAVEALARMNTLCVDVTGGSVWS